MYNKLEVLKQVNKMLEGKKNVSAFSKAVNSDAIDFVDSLINNIDLLSDDLSNVKEILLNGAKDWSQYSYGGCGLIYDYDIAAHYCTPSAFKRSKEGQYNPNNRESWLDVQARALSRACYKIIFCIRDIKNNKGE